ncbi:small membrane protein YniD [Serratia aquatilis]|uniref:Small membrane protein YniD n=1 Tax=Serratia aquatilis TaxID=1737515 RepID=A0ABV6EDR5_9GAMM
MPNKRMQTKHWKMFVILVLICGALLLLRWAAIIFG